MEGVLRTTVGYTGGTTEDPNYRRLGDHTEAVEVEYDPGGISYAELLEVFWRSHDPNARIWARQYRNAVFYHTDEQRQLVEETRRRVEARTGRKVTTAVERAGTFYRAEDYHQKYTLRRHPELWHELRTRFPSERALLDSTAAARLNGYLGGYGSPDGSSLSALGLPSSVEGFLRRGTIEERR